MIQLFFHPDLDRHSDVRAFALSKLPKHMPFPIDTTAEIVLKPATMDEDCWVIGLPANVYLHQLIWRPGRTFIVTTSLERLKETCPDFKLTTQEGVTYQVWSSYTDRTIAYVPRPGYQILNVLNELTETM